MNINRKRRHDTAVKVKLMDTIATMFLGALYGLLIVWVGANWFTGCGTFERTIDGQIIHGKCILIPWVSQ